MMHAVYYIILKRRIIYVGRSIAPQGRWRRMQKLVSKKVKLRVIAWLESLVEAQQLEIAEIKRLRPNLNKYVASSPSRLGRKNSPKHIAALIFANKGRRLSAEHRAKLWEFRSRRPEDNPFFGRRHTEETKMKIRAAVARQFADPVKRNRHRRALIKAMKSPITRARMSASASARRR